MSKRILILDDEMDSNITLETVLQHNGFKVDSYEDPILALENFKTCFYDLAILDTKMPKMNGSLVYREIKKLAQCAWSTGPSTPELFPVVFFASNSSCVREIINTDTYQHEEISPSASIVKTCKKDSLNAS